MMFLYLCKTRCVSVYRRSLEHLRARRQQEEDARQAQVAKDGTFSGLLRSAAPWVVAVALGATSILVLDFIMQEDDAKRLLRQRA